MYNPTKPHNEIIKNAIKRTWDSRWLKMVTDSYFIKRFYTSMYETDHTDGIGTKGQLHWQFRTFRNAVLDALAMNLNDLQMFCATPYKLQNHIFLPKEDNEAVKIIINALADECLARDITITGGECAVHDDMRGLEISITVSGFANKIVSANFEKGDLLVGLASNGLHSNGFTLLRELMQEHGTGKLPYRDSLLNPTRFYDLSSPYVKGAQHITGGAFHKLKGKLENLNAVIFKNHSLNPHEEFHNIYKCVYSSETMYKNFNCGIGMVVSVDPKYVDLLIGKIGGEVIGEVREGEGKVFIESKFDNNVVIL